MRSAHVQATTPDDRDVWCPHPPGPGSLSLAFNEMKGNEPVTRTLNPRAVLIVALPLLLGIPTAGFAQAPPMLRSLTGPAAAALSGGEAEGLQTSELGFSRGQSPLLQPLSPQVRKRKSASAAFIRELLFPVWGHIYAENGNRGVPAAAVHFGGVFVGLVVTSLADDLPSGPDALDDPRCKTTTTTGPGGSFSRETTCTTEMTLGHWVALGAIWGGKIWGLVSAVRTVNEHNRSVASSSTATLGLLPTPDGRLGVGMALRF